MRPLLSWIMAVVLLVLLLSRVSGPRKPAPASIPPHVGLAASFPRHAEPKSELQAFDSLSSLTAPSGLSAPSPESFSNARGRVEAEPAAARRATFVQRLVGKASLHPAVLASVRRIERIEPLSKGILPNTAFERSLRAASSSSALSSGQDLFRYSPSTLSFSAPADLRTFSYRTPSVRLGREPLRLGSTDSRERESAATLKTSLVVPAFHRRLTLNLGGGYDRLHRPETTILPYYPYDSSSTVDDDRANALGEGASPIASAGKSDTEGYIYGAGAAVPVSHDLHLGIGYTAQRLSGMYGIAPNALPANRKDAYSGSLTFAPRGGKSTLSLIGGQSRYSDDAAPNASYTERRGDLMFSVKF